MNNKIYLTVEGIDYLTPLQQIIVKTKLSSGAWKSFRHEYIFREVEKTDKNGKRYTENHPIKKTELETLVAKTKSHHKYQKTINKYF